MVFAQNLETILQSREFDGQSSEEPPTFYPAPRPFRRGGGWMRERGGEERERGSWGGRGDERVSWGRRGERGGEERGSWGGRGGGRGGGRWRERERGFGRRDEEDKRTTEAE